MKAFQYVLTWLLILQLTGVPAVLAQPVLIQPGNPFGNQQLLSNGAENLRVSQRDAAGTDAELIMDYSYDGFAGPTAQLLPVIGKKGQTGVGAWFGSDPVTVGRGKGTITLRVRYFNDEPGVPAIFSSDQVRILLLNQSGTALITAVPFLKTIHWGSANAGAATKSPPRLAMADKAAAQKLAQEKRAAEDKAKLELAAREKARLQAEAETRARNETQEKARAETLAREQARTQDQARKLAEAKRITEEKALAEAKAKSLAEAQAREQARLKADAEAARLAQEQRAAEEKAVAAAKARKNAEEKAQSEALAQAKAEIETKRFTEEKAKAEGLAQAPTAAIAPSAERAPAALEIARDKKTKVTNVDIVNRSIDRTQMTIGVEFEYKDQLSDPMIGVEVLRESEPEVSRYFVSRPSEIGKSRRNFALLPVKFQPPASLSQSSDFGTDKVLVYLTDKRAQRYNILPATMVLRWRAPGSKVSAETANANLVEIDDFKQNDPSTGNISVKYNLLAGKGKLRARIYAEATQTSAAYFITTSPEIQVGGGLQFIAVEIDPDAKTPTDLIRADTIEIEMLDPAGKILARASRKAAMIWTRPK